jgi:hypothetical protein
MTTSQTLTPPRVLELAAAQGTRGRLHITAGRVPGARTVGISVVVSVGTAHERPGEAGFAHLSEHFMHQCARNHDDQLVEDHIAGVGGISNAQTYPFHTEYSYAIPAPSLQKLPLWFDRACARGALPPLITHVDVKRESAVIRQEVARRMSTSPAAGFPWIDALGALSTDHGLRHNAFSDLRDINTTTPDRIVGFLDRTYRNAAISVAVAGPWDPHEVIDFLGARIAQAPPATDVLGDLLDGPHGYRSTVPTRIPMSATVRYVPDAVGVSPEVSQAEAMVAIEWANLAQSGTHWQSGLFGATMGPDHRVVIGSRPHDRDITVPQWDDVAAPDRDHLFSLARANALDDIDRSLSSTATFAAMSARDSVFGVDTLGRRGAVEQTTPERVRGYLQRIVDAPAGRLWSPGPEGVELQ